MSSILSDFEDIIIAERIVELSGSPRGVSVSVNSARKIPRVHVLCWRHDTARAIASILASRGLWIERIYGPCDTHGVRTRISKVIARLRKTNTLFDY